ncbi:hypothetical protein [Actinophytocola sediminis]
MIETPHTRWVGDEMHGHSPDLTPVWVRLDVTFPRGPDAPRRTVPDGLDLHGNVRGLLSGWLRRKEGDWLGVVNFAVPYADGRRNGPFLRDQLVPAEALTPRRDHEPLP